MRTQTDIHDGRNNVMSGCHGRTYAAKKVDLLKQLGYHNVTESMFTGLSESEIDRKARRIIMS